MNWPFSTPVSFETKLTADEVKQRLQESTRNRSRTGWLAGSAFDSEGFAYSSEIGERFCKLATVSGNRDQPARILILDLDSLRMEPLLRGTWRPAVSAIVSLPIFAGALLYATLRFQSPVPAIAGLVIVGMNLLAMRGRMTRDEPCLEAFVRDTLRPHVVTGPLERYEIRPSLRPGRMQIRVAYQFHASAVKVYQAFLQPELARQFLFATSTGTMVRAEINARVGGEFNFVDRRDGVDVLHTGIYTELQSPSRIVFDFSVPMYSPASATVMIELSPLWPGCRVLLTCDGVLPEYAEQTRDGWELILAKADSVLLGQDAEAIMG